MTVRDKSLNGLLISILCAMTTWGSAQNPNAYIRHYADIAVGEMLRTGIPASIKLAQGMLESNCGASELACKANNHFGIKCGGDWAGKGFHKEDDDFKEGKLMKSCFREFDSALESFVAHSDFLTDPKKANRYGSLFELKSTDYKGWARGLSRSGYATDPQYADKLIRIIEENKLFELDEGNASIASHSKPTSSLGYNLIRYNNDVKYIVAREGESLASIAEQHDVSENQLERFNDHAYQKEFPLVKGSKIYLQPKRNAFHGKKKFHVLQSGEDVLFLAQEYGMKIDAILKRNGLEANQVPLPGQKIMLKGKSKSPLRTVNPYDTPAPSIPIVKEAQSVAVKPPTAAARPPVVQPPAVQPSTVKQASMTKPIASTPPPHMVSKGDTLYNIATRYGLSVEELKKRNNLSADTISIGQKLLIVK